jgi:TM2 domain-containing membrane protein YozV
MSTNYAPAPQEGNRNYIVTLLLAWFLGIFGIHRFYTGYILIGVIQLITGGGCGIWTLIDVISIAMNKYQDAEGNDLADYNPGCGMIALIVIIVGFILGGISGLLGMFTIS